MNKEYVHDWFFFFFLKLRLVLRAMLMSRCVACAAVRRIAWGRAWAARERRAACTWNAACFRGSQLVESKLSVKRGNSYSFVIADWLKTEHTGAVQLQGRRWAATQFG